MARLQLSNYLRRNIQSLMDRFRNRGIEVERIGSELEYDEKDHEAIMRIINE